jgi:hypothetical protein
LALIDDLATDPGGGCAGRSCGDGRDLADPILPVFSQPSGALRITSRIVYLARRGGRAVYCGGLENYRYHRHFTLKSAQMRSS